MHLFKLRTIVACGLVALCFCTVQAQADETTPTTWNEVSTAAYSLMEEERFDEALDLVAQSASELEDRDFELSNLTIEILWSAGRTEDALSAWEQGLDDGYFYFVIPRSATYDPARKDERFHKALARNNKLREKANKKSKPEFKVIKPASYDSDRSYPLVMVIHGGNQSIVKAMGRWNPDTIGDDVLIAYVQSSMRANSKSYRWDLSGVDIYSRPMAQDEVLGMYREIVRKYPVDVEQVTLMGFSQGGNLALNMASEGTIPARGFIAGCPATRSPVSAETAAAAAARGLTGTIFVGETDWTAATTQTTIDAFGEAGLTVDHIIMAGKGHEFPDDFDQVLRDALDKIHQH
jgi:hypothetical protein